MAELIARASAEVAAERPGAAHEETLLGLTGGHMPPLADTLARARAMAAEHGGFARLEALAREPGAAEPLAADAALAGLKALSVPARDAGASVQVPARTRTTRTDARPRVGVGGTPTVAPAPVVAAEPTPAPAPARPVVAAEPAPAPSVAQTKPAEPAPAPVAVTAEPAPAPAPVAAEPTPAPAPAPVAAAEPAPTPIAAAEPTPAPAPAVAQTKPAEPTPPSKAAASEDLPEEVADAAIVDEKSAVEPVAARTGMGSQFDIAGPAMLGTEIEIDIANVDADLLTGDASIDADLLSGDASIDTDLFTGDAELDALLLDNGPVDPERKAELAAEAVTQVRQDTPAGESPDRASGPPAIPDEPPTKAASGHARAAQSAALDDWPDDDLGDIDELSFSMNDGGRPAAPVEVTAVGPADGGMFADEPTALQPEQSAAAREVRGISDEPLPPLPIDGDAIPVMASDERASAMALPLHDFSLDGLDDEPDASFEIDEDEPVDAVLTRQQPGAGGHSFDPSQMPTHVSLDADGPSPLDSALDELEFDADLEIEDIEIVDAGTSGPSAPAMPPAAPSSSERVAAGTPPYSPPASPPTPPQSAQGYPTRPLTPIKASPLPPSANRPALPGLPPAPGDSSPHHAGQFPAVPSYPAPSTQPPPGYPPYPAMPQAPYVPAPPSPQPGYPQAPSYPPNSYPQAPTYPAQNPGYPQNPTYPVAPAEQQQRPGDDDDDKKRGFFGRIFKK